MWSDALKTLFIGIETLKIWEQNSQFTSVLS